MAVIIFIILLQSSFTNILSSRLFPSYEHYFSSQYASSGWLAVSFSVLQSVVLYHIVSSAVDFHDSGDRLCLLNFTLLLGFSVFGYSMNLFTRLSSYFWLIGTVELPNILCKRQSPTKKIWLFCICAVSIVMFVVVLILRPNWQYLYPYEFWSP